MKTPIRGIKPTEKHCRCSALEIINSPLAPWPVEFSDVVIGSVDVVG